MKIKEIKDKDKDIIPKGKFPKDFSDKEVRDALAFLLKKYNLLDEEGKTKK